jgi:hypothetical protein
MIKDVSYWEAWEREYIAKEPVDFARNLWLLKPCMSTRACSEPSRPLIPWEGLK